MYGSSNRIIQNNVNKINYDKKMQETIKENKAAGRRPKLLLHVCCAPCSSHCIELLREDFDLVLDFYNPNIENKEEFDKRKDELLRFREAVDQEGTIETFIPEYRHEEFLDRIKGFEEEPERGKRCIICYRQRLEQAARSAKELEADYFTTTLTISPQKDSQVLNRIGEAVGNKYGIEFLNSDFKKRGGYQHSVELSNQYGLYRQDYCGCEFSKNTNKE